MVFIKISRLILVSFKYYIIYILLRKTPMHGHVDAQLNYCDLPRYIYIYIGKYTLCHIIILISFNCACILICFLLYKLKNDGVLIESFDALFGLPRKKSAGSSVRQPLHGDNIFYTQEHVDKFVQSYHSTVAKPQSLSKVKSIN